MMAESARRAEESQKTMMTMFMELIKTMNTPKGPDASLELMKEQIKAQTEVAKAASAKSDKLLELIVANKLADSDNKFDMAFKMMEFGEKRTEKLYERLEEARRESEEKGPFEDDGSIKWGKVINGVFEALPLFAGKFMQQPALPRPASPMETALLPHAPQRPAQPQVRQPQPQVRPPVRPAQPAPATQQIPPSPAASQPNLINPIELTPTPVAPIHDHIDEVAPMVDDPLAQPVPAENPPPPPPPPVATIPSEVAAQAEAHLRQYITEAMAQAVVDVTADPAEYEWVDIGLAKWNSNFLQHLASLPMDSNWDTAVVAEIGQRCDPAVWEKLSNLFYDENGVPGRYQKFIASVREMIEAFKNPAQA
jgi:hypothetical protein